MQAGKETVGGIISRVDGKLVTSEMSGTYGQNWTDDIRGIFVDFMKEHGVDVLHHRY